MSDKPLDADEPSLNIDQLIADFKARAKAGEKFSFEKMLEAHPEHTDELTRYFKQWKESETPSQPDKAGAEELSTETSAPGKISLEDATAHTMIQGTGDSESSLTQAYDQSGNASATSVEISESFGRYTIQKVLGQGAMGAVYLAKDTQLDRDVALKIPKFGDGNGVDEEELLARFYREARAAATLRSPNICPVYDVGEIDGQHYITMAFIEGRPLKDYTKSKKTHSEKQIITTIRKLALGLAEAHEIGVIHRDLKPANIMVDLKGEPVVMDFGLARRSSSDDVQVTQSGAIIGTPAYMAPEQVAGDQSAIDHQADIYALGVIMYELITGEMPFKGNLMALLQQIALNNPTKPSELRPDIDPRLEAICLKMIAGDQAQRYQSMTDVATDLQEVLRNPDERHRQAQARKKGPKPKSLPTAKEESNPALISIDRSKSSAERLRAKQGKKSSSTGKATAASKPKSSGPPKKLLIAGGIGGLVLLLGLALFVRDGKQDEQTAAANSLIAPGKEVQAPEEKPEEKVVKTKTSSPPPLADASFDSAVAKQDPQRNEALYFNGKTSRVEVPDFQLSGSPPLTLEGWLTPSPKSTSNAILFYGGKLDSLTIQVGGIRRWEFGGRQASTDRRVEVFGPRIKEWETRTHVAGQWDGKSLQLFIDGKPVKRNDNIGSFTPQGILEIGGHDGSRFKGKIDEIRISKTLRYKTEFTPPDEFTNDQHTLALYHFNEGSGNVLKDYSGNGYDGKIIDAKWVRVDTETIAASPPPPAIAPLDAAQAKVHQEAWADYLDLPVEKEVELPGGEKMAFVLIPPGEFIMGSTEEEQAQIVKNYSDFRAFKGILASEGPQHRVRISRPFYMGKYEVTQSQWLALIENIPPGNPRQLSSTRPAENISWDETQLFFEKFNHGFCPENMQGMLPTEAQWEYACRAGTITSWSFGDNVADLKNHAWFDANSSSKTQPAGKLPPNNFGLYDMHGNVCEWCLDTPSSTFYRQSPLLDPVVGDLNSPNHIYRGGNIHLNPVWCRSAYRSNKSRETKKYGVGFRAIMKIDDVAQARFPGSIPLSSNTPPSAVAPFDAAKAKQLQQAWADHLGVPIEYENSIGMKFRLLPPGEFLMGSTPEEIEAAVELAGEDEGRRERINSEAPQHNVVLTQPIYMGVTEVTQSQYEQVTGTNPSYFSATGGAKNQVANMETGDYPVEQVSWNDAADFCAKLSQQEKLKPFSFPSGEPIKPLDGTGYRLPTEAEWEFACRAGTTTRYWSGDEYQDLGSAGWFGGVSGGRTHAVGELKANPFGLSDLHGNVWEWVQDGWDPAFYKKFENEAAVDPFGPFSASPQRVRRGGSWMGHPSVSRSSRRLCDRPLYFWRDLGFRVVLPVDAVKQAVKVDEGMNVIKDGETEFPVVSIPYILTSEEYEWTEPVNLGPNVNSGENDVYPTLSADGLSLIFTSTRGKNAILYECLRASVNDEWGPAQELIGTNISQHDQISPWLSTDGLTLLFGNKPFDSDNVNIFQTRRATRDAPWDTPIDLGSPINSDKEDGGGAITPDGLTMYLSSKRPGSQYRDLYRARRPAVDAPWQEPILLGREINLAGEEKSPQLLADGKSLMYLSCKGRECQLMLAQPVADGSYHVQALESPIDKISFCLSTDGQTLIFDSKRPGGFGDNDLWMSRRVKKTIDMEKSVKVDHDSSQTIDLLADLEPTTWNSEDMSWQMQDGILAGNSSASRKKKEWVGAKFPQEISGDFDIELELKQSGFAPLQIDLPLGDKQAIRLHLGGLGCALMVIDGKEDRDAAPEHSNKDAKLKRDVWQRLTAKVRHEGENVSVDVALDGERIGLFSGPRSRITLPKWVKPDPVHVKFAGTGTSSILELEFRRAMVHIDPPPVMQIEKTSPK